MNVGSAGKLLKKLSRRRVLVVGDLMLDRYIYGTVSRISPEAPVPVVAVQREVSMPGGAANVARNVAALGGQTALAGFTGRDADGRELVRLLKRTGVDTRAVLDAPGRPTTVKERVIADRQQVVRVDFERARPLSAAQQKQLAEAARRALERAHALVIEDYGKGVLNQELVSCLLAQAARQRMPVGLDPKDARLDMRGITFATPNRKEAFAIAGFIDPGPTRQVLKDKPLLAVGRCLLDKWNAQWLMVTLGPQGMLLLPRDGAPYHVPTRAREVFDVSGAGDTVVAVCAAALAGGASFLEAAELANYAAGVVVGKLGTATCSAQEVMAYMSA